MATSSDSSQSAWDVTGDGVFTISDAGVWLNALFFLPGNKVLATLMETSLGRFFEMTPDWYGGWFSGIVSLAIWLIVLSIIGVIHNFIVGVNDTLKENFGESVQVTFVVVAILLVIGVIAIAVAPGHGFSRTGAGLVVAFAYGVIAAIVAIVWSVGWLISRLVARFSAKRLEKVGHASRNDSS